MTTHIGLFEKFLTRDNFQLAFKRVSAKGTTGGIDQVSVEQFAEQSDRGVERLISLIQSGQYQPEPVAAVKTPKLNNKGGFRELGLPTVADKIVQTALLQVVEPLAEKLFLDTSYGYRPGKGPSKALRRVEHELRQHRTWLVSQDIDNFFDSLDHSRLLTLFAKLVNGDSRLVDLVALWCKMGIVQKDGRWRDVQTGVRQGQVLSPLLANLYLHDIDLFVRERKWGWVRYADDYLLLCRDEHEARTADLEVANFLKTILLSLNDNPTPITDLDRGFVFLGVQFQGETRSIAPDKVAKMERTIDWLLSPKNRLDLPHIMEKLTGTLEGWRRYYGFLDPGMEFARLNDRVIRQLRALLEERRGRGAITTATIPHCRFPVCPPQLI